MERDFDELTEDQLNNVFGETVPIEKILEHPELYRPEKIEELRQEYETLLASEEQDLDAGRGGR